MSSAPPDALALLRANYAKKIPEKLAELDQVCAGLATSDRLAAVQDLRNLVHKLAGSAPTFGYGEMGTAARATERVCDALLAEGAVSDDQAQGLRDGVDDIKARAGLVATAQGAGADGETALQGRVMVVEDEPSQALFAQVVLKKAGLEVKIVANPLDVADALSAFRPGLVFMDMNMPHKNGDEVAAEIRARGDDMATVPIVFLSGEEDPVRRESCMKAGGSGFVSKPVQPQAMKDAVRQFIKA